MRFSTITTLVSLASLAQSAPTVNPNDDKSVSFTPFWGPKYQSQVFYVNWAIYARKHFVTDLPADKLTRINYAFANISATTGEVTLSDVWADTQFPYPGDVQTNASQLLGNFNQLYKLKQANRNVKAILSVGGWSFRGFFFDGLSTPDRRQKFCDSAIALIADLGLDGFDVDWEYATSKVDADNFVDTLRRCRKTFDAYSAAYARGYHFEITISAPAGPQHYSALNVRAMDAYVDHWNLMAFDYQGPNFSNFTGHSSNVFPSSKNPKATNGWVVEENKFEPFNTNQAIQFYKANVASPCKIILGMPLYGYSFANVTDQSKNGRGLGQTFMGPGDGTWAPGTLDYKVLPLNGSKVYHDEETMAAWSWDAAKKEFVTFDTPKSATWKTNYLKQQGLGGAWWWESDGDRPITDDKSIIATVVKALGGPQNLQQNWNNLYYPKSKYYNIRGAAK
ncbi:Chitinase 4 [Pleosporales sp. CAS-2024a]